MGIDLGTFGVWLGSGQLTPQVATELAALGYGAIWIGGSPPGGLELAEALLDATQRISVATGIVNMWKDDAATVAASYHRIETRHPGRFVLGVGVGHPEMTPEYRTPYEKSVDYLDGLDEAGVPVERRVLAALGPRMLRLAGRRSAGAHPYLTTPRHTALAREILGAGPLLAPEQKVVLDTDVERARGIARPAVKNPYLGLVNYRTNLLREGWSDDDLAGDGSDRLVDALVLHGDAATVARGLRAHLEAGADHVAIQALGDDPMSVYRSLAAVLEAQDVR
jgi:probable F420-dependent oxidoreductase